MSPCESVLESPLMARTFTGPTSTEVDCNVGVDSKHFVSMENLRNYPVLVMSVARIISEPRLIHFELADQTQVNLTEDTWKAICLLDTKEPRTYGVKLLSDRPNGTEQNIEVKLVINRLHAADEYPDEIPTITVFS